MKVPLAARARGAKNLDVEKFLPWIAELGYTGVEVGMGVFEDGPGPEEFRQLADSAGLSVCTFMGQRAMLRDNLDEVARYCDILGCRYVVMAWGMAESEDEWRELAAEFNATGAEYRERGLQYCYHNHDHEIATQFGGTCALDILLEETDPENFRLQLDLGWVSYGGQDPIEFLKEHEGLCPVVHLRDVGDHDERGEWAPIGEGVLEIPEMVTTAVECGAEWVILEQKALGDLTRNGGIEACAEYMRSVGLL